MQNKLKGKEGSDSSVVIILKKFSFLLVLLGALVTHMIINNLVIKSGDRIGYIVILWLAASAISFNMILYSFSKKYKDGWNDFNKGEFDIDTISGKKTEKRICIENSGLFSEGLIEKISNHVFRSVVIRVVYCIITYSFFDKEGNKITKIKKYNDQGLKNIPKVGDKVKILYDPLNPNNSVIFHEEVNQEIESNKLKQKKYTITIINSIK